MTSPWHQPVSHAARGGPAAALSETSARLRGQNKACQGASQKQQGFLLVSKGCHASLGIYAARGACRWCARSKMAVS